MQEKMLTNNTRVFLGALLIGYRLAVRLRDFDDDDMSEIGDAVDDNVDGGLKHLASLVEDMDSEDVVPGVLRKLLDTLHVQFSAESVSDIRRKLLADLMLRKISEIAARVPMHGNNSVNTGALRQLKGLVDSYLEEHDEN